MPPSLLRSEVLLLYGFSPEEAQCFSPQNRRLIHLSSQEESPFNVVSCNEALKRVAWENVFSSLDVVFSSTLTGREREEGVKIVEKLRHFHRGAQGVLADMRDLGVKITHNILRNLERLPTAHTFLSFLQAFRDVPAVICGAGPSLEKALPYLSNLRQRSLIIAGGSALNALTHASITPHFAAAIDPGPPPHLFRHQAASEAPLFYQNRVASQLLKDCHSPHIWVPDNVTYPIEGWLMERLGMPTCQFEAGWNVVTFSLQLAVAMGCNPIMITGVDLCHTADKTYAAGVAMPEGAFTPLSLEEGKETKADFLLAAAWIEEFVTAHPHIQFINASQGGLQLRGMQSMSAAEYGMQLSLHSADIEGKIYSLLHSANVQLPTVTSVGDVIIEFKEKLASCLDLIERMEGLLQKWYPQDPSSKGEYILLDVECSENPLYTYLLEPLWNVWQWAFIVRDKNEPYEGFTLQVQKLLFFQKVIREMQGAIK